MAEFREFWKWFPVEFTYLIVGKYINLDCYGSNCEAEEKISLDVSIHEAEFVAMLQNAICIASSGSNWTLF